MNPQVDAPSAVGSAAWRGAAFFALWLVLMPSLKPGDLAIGLAAAAAATWASLRLQPPAAGRLRLARLLALLPHFLWESVRAGIDVALRAVHPRLPLRPGFVECPVDLRPGLGRNTFATITSLMPGSVPSGETERGLVYHCLDLSQPVVEQLQAEERRIAGALAEGHSDG